MRRRAQYASTRPSDLHQTSKVHWKKNEVKQQHRIDVGCRSEQNEQDVASDRHKTQIKHTGHAERRKDHGCSGIAQQIGPAHLALPAPSAFRAVQDCEVVQASMDWAMLGNDPYGRMVDRSCGKSFRSDVAATVTLSALEVSSSAPMIKMTIVE
jgi:hypothetical protein